MPSPAAARLKQQFEEFLASTSNPDGTPLPLDETRRLQDVFTQQLTPEPPDVSWHPVDAGGVPGQWSTPLASDNDRAILYFHGGGYVLGSAEGQKHCSGHLAKAVGCRVLTVDYRLAPEHPFPAAVEDAVAAYRWLLAEGYEPGRLAVAGDSAGGGLTLALLTRLRETGVALPAAAVLLSPWVDMELTGASVQDNAPNDWLQGALTQMLAELYLNGHDPKDPLASPLHADLTGLPSILIQVGGHETLLDDARRIAEVARQAGVDTSLDVFPEMTHVFQVGAGRVPESDEALGKIGAFLRPRLGLAA